jgi:hypothetical protein
LTASVVDANGKVVGTRKASNAKKPAIDCFYVYPTVSDDNSSISTINPGPEEISIAEYQAQRFSQVCRVFAPIYQQTTLKALFGSVPRPTAAQTKKGDDQLVAAWHE